MKTQTFYAAEKLDYWANYEKLCNRFASVEIKKGIVTFYIPPGNLSSRKISVQIFPSGKVGVVWENVREKERILPFLEELFVGENGEKIVLKPLRCHITNVPPPPEKFTIAWCKEKLRYDKVNVDHLPKEERQLWNLDVDFYKILTQISLGIEDVGSSLFGSPFILIYEGRLPRSLKEKRLKERKNGPRNHR